MAHFQLWLQIQGDERKQRGRRGHFWIASALMESTVSFNVFPECRARTAHTIVSQPDLHRKRSGGAQLCRAAKRNAAGVTTGRLYDLRVCAGRQLEPELDTLPQCRDACRPCQFVGIQTQRLFRSDWTSIPTLQFTEPKFP